MSKTEATELNALKAGLDWVNTQFGLGETAKSILGSKIIAGVEVVIIVSDYRKIRVSWDDLGLRVTDEPQIKAQKSDLPETTLKQ